MNLTHATSYPFCSFRRRVRITPLMRHRMNHRVIGRFFEELCFVMCLDLSFTCGCDLCFDLMDCVCEFVTCGCDIMCENGFVVIYICDYCNVCDIYVTCDIYLNCLCQWNAKNKKKIAVSVDLPSAMVMTLGKAGKLCRVPGHCTWQRFFFKKSKKSLPSAKLGRHSAKSFLKKLKKWLCRVRAAVALGKEFF